MAEDWRSRLAVVRQSVRRAVVWHGVGWIVAALVAGVAVAGLFDWFFHVSVPLRLLFLGAIAIGVGWLVYRRLILPLGVSLSDLQLALRVERMHPELQESFSTMVAFAGRSETDPRLGSVALRHAIAQQAEQLSRDVDFSEIVSRKPVQQGASWGIAAGVLAAILVSLDPLSASIAVRRLALPFTGPEWPKKTRLANIQFPETMAKGDPFQATVDVEGVVPERIEVEYRFADGEQPAPSLLSPSVDSSARFVASLDAATQSFEFKITGGDAESDWFPVKVVPAPDVSSLSLQLMPPAYTRRTEEALPLGKGHVDAVVGTKVQLEVVSNKPLQRAELVWESGEKTPATIAEDRVTVTAEFLVTKNDTYRILIEDTGAMTNEHRSPKSYRVEARPDDAPEVFIETPTGDVDVTRKARPTIKARARDEFGLQKVELRYEIERPGTSPQPATDGDAPPFETIPLAENLDSPTEQAVEHGWDLATLELPLGSIVAYRVAAIDLRDVPGPNVGESRILRFRVVAESDLVRQVETEQKLIREELDRLRKLEENALTQTTDLMEKAKQVDDFTRNDRDKLHATETIQKRVREKVSAGDDSIQRRLRDLGERLAQNRIEDLDTKKRLDLIDSELNRIGEQHLSEIERSLSQARKSTEQSEAKDSADASKGEASKDEPKNELAEPLETARDHQERVVESLDSMLDQLDKWESVAEVVSEARDLERRQKETAEQVGELAQSTLGKSAEDLSSEEKVGLSQSAARQEELREQLGRLERKMAKQEEKIRAEDPDSAQAIKGALDNSRASNLAGKMSETTQDIRNNRLADAGQRQNEIGESLRQMVESLENRQEQELKRLVKELKEAEEQLEGIREEQRKLRKETEDAEQIADADKRAEELRRLQRRQAELQAKSEEFARRLSRLQAKSASRSSGRAAGRMGEASRSMEQGAGEEAGQDQEEALDQLEQAQQELAQARQEAEEKLAEEQLAKVADTIKSVHERQMTIAEDVKRLDAIREKEGKLTRGQTQSVLGLSRAEQGLAGEAAALQEKLAEAKVFHLVIEEAVEQMNVAAEQLGDKATDQATQRSLDRAANKFGQLLDSLRKDNPKNAQAQQQGNQGEGQGPGGAQGGGQDGIPSIAQIKLLKSLQQEIRDDTEQLVTTKPTEGWSDDQKETFEKLSQRQGRLADIVRDMMKPAAEESTPFEETEP